MVAVGVVAMLESNLKVVDVDVDVDVDAVSAAVLSDTVVTAAQGEDAKLFGRKSRKKRRSQTRMEVDGD